MIVAHMIFGILVGATCGVMILMEGGDAILAVSAYSLFGALGMALSTMVHFFTTDNDGLLPHRHV